MKPKPDLFSDGLKRLQIDSIFDNPSLSCYTPINLTFKNFYQIEGLLMRYAIIPEFLLSNNLLRVIGLMNKSKIYRL